MCGVVSTRGERAFSLFITCLGLLFFVFLLELKGDVDVLGSVSDAVAGAFQVPANSYPGWLALVIVAGAILLIAGGTVTLIKNALDMFRE